MSFSRANAKMDVKPHPQCAMCGENFSRAFTLIEMLIVITIIAILMALLFPAFKGVQNQAKRTSARNDVTQIVAAISAFYTEYGQYPVTIIRSTSPMTGLTETPTISSSTNFAPNFPPLIRSKLRL
jgi:prepilin-type N-terminal cleavage/methylation domain-containing protein